VNERVEAGAGNGTLYNSLLVFDATGNLANHHRKLVPTYTERLVWGAGDARGLAAVDTAIGRVGGLICWEHWMPLSRHVLHASGEHVHVALWPTVHEMHQIASRHYAFEGRCFVVAAGLLMRVRDVPAGLALPPELAADPDKLLVLAYSTIGIRGDCDFMLWRIGHQLEPLQQMGADLLATGLGQYLTLPYSYLSMTKRSTYVDKLDPDHADKRRFITPFHSQYLFVYPFVKTHEWYQLPFAQRQAMMDEHIVLGNKYPSVRIHTTYAFGLDDHDFVLAFETDQPQDFLDLVMEMRESKVRIYTLRDTPIFTCIAKPFDEILKDLGG
jgi:chlorite dismutase